MKKLKNSVLLLLILSITVGAIASMSPVYANPTALSVIFPNNTNVSIDEYDPCESFDVKINVEDVSHLYTFDFSLCFDPAVLTATGIALGDFFPVGSVPWKTIIEDGYARYVVSMPIGTPYGGGVSGSGTLAIISFHVESTDKTILALHNTKLSSDEAPPSLIPHEAYDGFFNMAAGVVKAELYEWRSKVNHAAGIGKGHKSTVGEENLLEAYVINSGDVDVNVQVVFKVTDAAFTPVATVIPAAVSLPAGQTTILSATWTASETDVYLITAYLSYGQCPGAHDGGFGRTHTLRVLP